MDIGGKPVPLFPYLFAALAGILAGSALPRGAWPYLLAAGGFTTVYLFFLKKHFLFPAVFLLVFSANTARTFSPDHNDISSFLPFEGSAEGRASAASRRLVLSVDRITIAGKEIPARGKLLVTGDITQPPPFSAVAVEGAFSHPPGARSPGGFDWRKSLRRESIFAVCRAERAVVTEKGPFPFLGMIREHVRETVHRFLTADKAAVMEGMLLGDPAALERETLEKFRRAGVMHILAVSGLHAGLVFFSAFYLLGAFRVPKKPLILICLLFMYLYVAVTGARPPAVRAALMFTALAAGDMCGGRGNVFNTLCFAALIILGFSPGLLFTPGFLFSFLAVFGIAYLSAPLAKFMGRPLATSTSAVAGILPVLAWNFFYIPALSPLTNLAVVPLAAAAVSAGLLMLVFSGFPVFPAAVYGAAAELAVTAIEFVTGLAASSRAAGFYWGRPSIVTVAGFYIILLSLGMKKRKTAAAVLGISLFAAGHLPQGTLIAELVHRGAPAYIYSEGGETVVFAGKEDIDPEDVASFLYTRGIRRVKDIYILHPPYAGLEGLREFSDAFRVRNIYYPGAAGNEYRWQLFKEASGTQKIKAAAAGERVDYRKFSVHIHSPEMLHSDIRDNSIQASVRGRRDILVRTKNEIPPGEYDLILDERTPGEKSSALFMRR